MHEIARVSENPSVAVEEIAAGAEEMSVQVGQISGDAVSMAGTAETLRILVEKFTLDNSPRATKATVSPRQVPLKTRRLKSMQPAPLLAAMLGCRSTHPVVSKRFEARRVRAASSDGCWACSSLPKWRCRRGGTR